jgi:serine/threonine protein kinase
LPRSSRKRGANREEPSEPSKPSKPSSKGDGSQTKEYSALLDGGTGPPTPESRLETRTSLPSGEADDGGDATLTSVRDRASDVSWLGEDDLLPEELEQLDQLPPEHETLEQLARADTQHDDEDSTADSKPSASEVRRKRRKRSTKARTGPIPSQLGRYRVLGELGRGGMGAVLRAIDEELDREVAIKVLPADARKGIKTRFRREAQALAKLDDPHIVRVHAYERHDDRDLLVMEHVAGESLHQQLQRGPLEEEAAWRLLRHVVRAMVQAEGAGILHRDLKPGNILWDAERRVYKVCDFGLARFQTSEDALTQAGTALGTPFYMSPEQVRGVELDARSDMYSLGLTLHEALTDHIPFTGGPIAAVLLRRIDEDSERVRERLPTVSPEMDELVAWLTFRDRAGRPPSWADLQRRIGDDAERVDGGSGSATNIPSVPSGEPAIGELLGDFQLLEVIGRGGMGVVYKVRKPSGKIYALKSVLVARGDDDDAEERRQRFQREVEALRRLQHPCVIGVHAYGRKGPFDFYVMDYLEGKSLDLLVGDEEFSRADRLRTFNDLCLGVAHAHERGVVHRDLKPSNILVTDKKQVVVLDFGVAKIAEEGRELGLTRTGDFVGTPNYMAPEQILNPKDVDERSDVFALGVILYELFVGKHPFPGETSGEISYKILREHPPRPSKAKPTINPAFDPICLQALDKRPERRYQKVDQLRKAVLRYRRGTAAAETWLGKKRNDLYRYLDQHRVPVLVGVLLSSLAYVPLLALLVWLLLR